MSRWIAAAMICLIALPTAAQEVKPDEVVKMRQGVMTAIKWQFAEIGAVAKGERPFSEDVIRRATHLVNLAKVAPEGFIVPSASESVPASKAKAAIWQEKQAFSAGMRDFATEAERLAMAAQSRDGEQLKAQFAAVTKTCKSCHDKYRAE